MNYFSNNINYIFLLIIIFSNLSFGKEFDQLFKINHKIESGQNIDTSLNRSFDDMIYRLSGSTQPSNVWKIINAGNARKDFITKYSIKNISGTSYIFTEFNQTLLEQTFFDLNIPIIGKSRPVYMIMLEVDDGLNSPYFVSETSSNNLDRLLQSQISELASKRGVFIVLPSFDLKDSENILSYNYLVEPEKYLESKYDYDHLISIKVIKTGINEWKVTGGLEAILESKNFNRDFLNVFFNMLDKEVSTSLNLKTISYESNNNFSLKITNINSVNDYEKIKDLLFGIIGLNNIKINKFSNKTLFCEINFYGKLGSLLQEIDENSYLNLLNTSDLEEDISIEYKL